MSAKRLLRQFIAAMTEEEGAQALALLQSTTTPTDIYGTPWGQILSNIDPAMLEVSGSPSITIPPGIPDVE